MYEELERINQRPAQFAHYQVEDLWTEELTSKQILEFHLNEDDDAAAYNRETIDRSVVWMADHFNIGPGKKIADFGCGPGQFSP